jgi:RNase P/RNase MRP subunit POP5
VEAKEGVGVIHCDRGDLETLWASIELTRGEPVLKLTEFHVTSTVRLAQRRVY